MKRHAIAAIDIGYGNTKMAHASESGVVVSAFPSIVEPLREDRNFAIGSKSGRTIVAVDGRRFEAGENVVPSKTRAEMLSDRVIVANFCGSPNSSGHPS